MLHRLARAREQVRKGRVELLDADRDPPSGGELADGADELEEPARAPTRRRLGETYMERRGRHRRAVAAAVRKADFLSDLAEGLAGVNLSASDPGATKQLVASAVALDALAEGGAQRDAARAPKRVRRGAA